jgi:O-methyltransferase domain
MPVFDYLAQHPDEASLFSETMIGIHGEEPRAVAEAYDFSVFGTVVDVGGATGNLKGSQMKSVAIAAMMLVASQ